MKKWMAACMLCVILLACIACGADIPFGADNEDGQDWRTSGMYRFYEAGELPIAASQIYDGDTWIGYQLWGYTDAGVGPHFSDICFRDGGCTAEEHDPAEGLLVEDHTNDGLADFGIPLKDGRVLWFAQKINAYDASYEEVVFLFSDVADAKSGDK